MVTASRSNRFPIYPSRCLLTFHRAGLCHMIRLPWSMGKQMILARQFVTSPKSQGPIRQSRSEERHWVGI